MRGLRALSLSAAPCAVCCGGRSEARVPYVVRLFRKHLYEYVLRLL